MNEQSMGVEFIAMYAGCSQAGYLVLGLPGYRRGACGTAWQAGRIRVGDKHHAAEPGETPREWRLKAQPGSRSCLDDE